MSHFQRVNKSAIYIMPKTSNVTKNGPNSHNGLLPGVKITTRMVITPLARDVTRTVSRAVSHPGYVSNNNISGYIVRWTKRSFFEIVAEDRNVGQTSSVTSRSLRYIVCALGEPAVRRTRTFAYQTNCAQAV